LQLVIEEKRINRLHTKLGVTENSVEVQFLESLAIDEGNKWRCRDPSDIDSRY
jgi:hypothetical protein